MKFTQLAPLCAFSWLGLFAPQAASQLVISDTLTGASSSYQWQSLNGACLTAGDDKGTIPKCVGLDYYGKTTQVGGVSGRLGTSGDDVGSGALRLTNGDTTTGTNGNDQTGAIYSKFTFAANQGLQVTFKTVTYGGNAYTNGSGQKSGADGMAFFLVDGDEVNSVNSNTETGASGGSLGYSCANSKANNDGLLGAYIGLGIDEFGNFSNPGDNTATGPGVGPGRVSLRGAGNIAWTWLRRNYRTYYPSSLSAKAQQEAVGNTCSTGKLWNYSGQTITDANGNRIANQRATTETVLTYPLIAYSDLPSGSTIYNQEAISLPKRGSATPIAYGLKITQNGLLSLSYSYNGGVSIPVITDQAITESNGALPSKFRFGFSAGTGGGSNVHEIMCFKAAQINSASSSAGINIPQANRVQVGTQLYLSYYHPTNWWGQLTATNLVVDPTTDAVSISPISNWDASCVLTGGACSATGTTIAVQAPSARQMLSWNGSTGVPLTWGGGITRAQKNALDSTSVNATTSPRLDYLRGMRANEVTSSGTGTYRLRDSVLGDIINSSPTWVGAPASPYTGTWKDALAPTTSMPEGSTSYATFASNNATRTNVVYSGANDGLVHGFRAGAYNANDTFDSLAANDGRELLAYMPAAVINTIHTSETALDYSSPQYSHNAYVDATPGAGDLFYAGNWHTWLVGGLGAGGNATGVIGENTSIATGALYALDITTPGNFSEANAASLVMGEWSSTSNTLSCPTDTTTVSCRDSLGSVYGTPLIRRLHDGNWAVIFGNGLNSRSGKAGIYVMTVNQTSGARTFRFLDTGVGPTTNTSGAVTARNGISHVTSADLDSDHITDYIYAGDAFGNLWRFDLTSTTASSWAVRSTPLYSTGGTPITTAVTVASATTASIAPRVIVSFGTGQILPQTLTSAAIPAPGTQSIYGIWDWDFTAWNAKGSTLYTSLARPQTVNANTLQAQTITTVAYANGAISGYRTVTQNAICWMGSTACKSGNTQFGWQITLPGTNEQVVYSPVLSDGLLLINTTLPSVSQVLSCDTQPASGYTMAITPDTGAAPNTSYFASATSNVVATPAVIAGIGLSATGSPSVVSTGTKKFIISQTSTGSGNATQVNPTPNGKGGRVTWIKWR